MFLFPTVVLPSVILLISAAPAQAQAQSPEAELQRLSEVGQRALAEHRYAEAEKAYERLRELSPTTAEVHAGLGLIYFQERKFDKAVPALRQARKLNPALPKTDLLLALCLSELGQYKEALPGLRAAFKQSGDDALRRMGGLQLQRAYTNLEQDDKAVETALDLVRLYPKDPEILYHSSRLFSNYAYLTTMKLAQVAPESVWMHQAAGEANESQALYDAAIREYREVLTQDPRRSGIHLRIGRTLLARAQAAGDGASATEDRTAAARELQQELELDPTNATASYELGEMRRKAGDLGEAQQLFEAAVRSYPDFAEAQLALGRVLVAAGKNEPAVVHLKKAIALDPANDVSFYQLSLAYRALGDAAGQKDALSKFQVLRARKQERNDAAAVRLQVTKQELEPKEEPRQE